MNGTNSTGKLALKDPRKAVIWENRKEKWKKRMLGSADKRGILGGLVVYLLLIVISFIFTCLFQSYRPG